MMLIVKMIMLCTCVLSGLQVQAAAHPWEPGVRDALGRSRAILISTDGKELPISLAAAQQSGYVTGRLNFYNDDAQAPQDNPHIPIELPATSLSKLIALMEEHAQEGTIKRGITVGSLQERFVLWQASDYYLLGEQIITYLKQPVVDHFDADLKQELQGMVNSQPRASEKYKVAFACAYIREQLGCLPTERAEQVLEEFQRLHAWKYVLPGPSFMHNDVFIPGPVVSSAEFSSDDNYVLTALGGMSARMWHTETGVLIGDYFMHGDGRVNSAAFSLDGKFIVTASDKTVRIWNVETRLPIGNSFMHDVEVSSVAFSPDDKSILTVAYNAVRIWSVDTSLQIGDPLQHIERVSSAKFSRDGKFIVTTSFDGIVRIWNVDARLQIGDSFIHDRWRNSAAFSLDGKFIVTASDSTVRIWDVDTRLQIGDSFIHDGGYNSVAFSHDGKFIVTTSFDGTVQILDVENRLQRVSSWEYGNRGSSAAFSTDSKSIVAVAAHRCAKIWHGVLPVEQLLACIAKGIKPCTVAVAVDEYQNALDEVR